MKLEFVSSSSSLAGVAILAACACGTSSSIAKLSSSYGYSIATYAVYPVFVVIGVVLILTGLWKRTRGTPLIALCGIALLLVGLVLVPPMSIASADTLSSSQLAGLAAYVAAGAVLVLAFYRAYPSRHPSASLLAMSGMALAVGCNCCLVTMGISGFAHTLGPSVPWLASTVATYSVATVLMASSLYRIGGVLPALTMIVGHAIDYYALELPATNVPIAIHGVNAGFLVKYPLMVLGTGMMVSAFAWAWQTEERAAAALQPAMAGD
jgi:hypothetical protein